MYVFQFSFNININSNAELSSSLMFKKFILSTSVDNKMKRQQIPDSTKSQDNSKSKFSLSISFLEY